MPLRFASAAVALLLLPLRPWVALTFTPVGFRLGGGWLGLPYAVFTKVSPLAGTFPGLRPLYSPFASYGLSSAPLPVLIKC